MIESENCISIIIIERARKGCRYNCYHCLALVDGALFARECVQMGDELLRAAQVSLLCTWHLHFAGSVCTWMENRAGVEFVGVMCLLMKNSTCLKVFNDLACCEPAMNVLLLCTNV